MITHILKDPNNFYFKHEKEGCFSILSSLTDEKIFISLKRFKKSAYDFECYKNFIIKKDDSEINISFVYNDDWTVSSFDAGENNFLTNEDISLIPKVFSTLASFEVLTSQSTNNSYIPFPIAAKVINEFFEGTCSLLDSWANTLNFFDLSTKKLKDDIGSTLTVERPSNSALKFILKPSSWSFEKFSNSEELTEEECNIVFSAQENSIFLNSVVPLSPFMVQEIAFLIKVSIKKIVSRFENYVLEKDDLFSISEIEHIQPKDFYIFTRSWVDAYNSSFTVSEITSTSYETIELIEMPMYPRPSISKKLIKKEMVSRIERFPERIREATCYLFDNKEINSKIQTYESLLVDLEANLEKMSKEDKEYFSIIPEDELSFLMSVSHVDHSVVPNYLNQYLDIMNERMQEMFKEIKQNYEDEIRFILQLIEKRTVV